MVPAQKESFKMWVGSLFCVVSKQAGRVMRFLKMFIHAVILECVDMLR